MTTTTPSYPPDIEQAAQRVRELSDRMIEIGKQSGLSWLEAAEKVLESLLLLEEEVAKGAQLEWVSALATTHADFVREVSKVYFDTVRNQLT